jgi:hypothetical protein
MYQPAMVGFGNHVGGLIGCRALDADRVVREVELAQDGGGGGDFGGGEPAIVIGVKQGQRGLRAALSGFEVVAPGGAVVLIGAGAILNWGGVERGADSAGGQDAQKLKNGKVCAGTAEKVGLGPDGIHWILGPI